MINISKIKLIIKTSTEGAITNRWVEQEPGIPIDIAPRQCFKCTDNIWSGHVIESSENTYCVTCFNEQFTRTQIKNMYKEGEQYYTVWDENDFDPAQYEIVHQRV